MRGSRGLHTLAAVALGAVLGLAPAAASAAAASAPQPPVPFTDLDGVSWALPSVAALTAQGVIHGVSATSFAPGQPLTAEAALTFLSRLFPDSSSAPATPLPGVDSWAQAAMAWALGKGLIGDATVAAATKPAARADVVNWTVRALGLLGSNPPQPTFTDDAGIPQGDVAAVGTAQADGLVVGDGSGAFLPASPITRAQMAVILRRAEQVLAIQPGMAAPFSWQGGLSAGAMQTLIDGTATAGSARLPAGTVSGGHLVSTTGGFAANYLMTGSTGAGSLTITSGGLATRVPFLWEEPNATTPGVLWLYTGANVAAFTLTLSGGTVKVKPASAATQAWAGTETLALQVTGDSETAAGSAQVTLGTVAETMQFAYDGPVLPVGALAASEVAAVANLLGQVPSGT